MPRWGRVYSARRRRGSVSAYVGAATLVQQHVAPAPVGHLPDSLAGAKQLEAGALVQSDGGDVLREDARLERPKSLALGDPDEGVQQRASNTTASTCRIYVDTHLADPAIDGSTGGWAERRPAEQFAIAAACGDRGIPCSHRRPVLPRRRRVQLECS